MRRDQDDAQCVQRCLKGDRTAFEELIEKYEKPIFNVAYRMAGNPEDARDITHTVFLKSFQKLKAFDPRYKFYSWIYRIAINETINFVQKRPGAETVEGVELPSRTKSPEDEARSAEVGRAIQKALSQLKPIYRTVIVLRHFLECSYSDMSGILNVPEKTVKSRLFTARQLLKDALTEQRERKSWSSPGSLS